MASAAVVLLAGCAAEVGPDHVAVGVAVGPVADVDYDAYYDGFYGPIYDGYWGDDGVFIYQTSEGGHWVRGDATHFRREAANGFNHIHGTTHAAPARNANKPPPG
jgi:hypothetical protein